MWRVRFFVEMLVHYLVEFAFTKRGLTGQKHIGDDAQRILIGCRAEVRAFPLFRSHIRHGPDHGSRRRQRFVFRREFGDPEVHQLCEDVPAPQKFRLRV